MRPIEYSGKLRVYFNRRGADPNLWCVAPDLTGLDPTWEISVCSVVIAAPSETRYQPKATPDDEDGRPSAWIATEGRLTVFADGSARIE